MTTDVLVEVDSATLIGSSALEQLEAVGYASALRGEPFPNVKGAPKRNYKKPQDIKDIIFSPQPTHNVTLRVFNAGKLILPLSVRASASIAAGGISDVGLFGKLIENMFRFYLETKLGLFGELLNIEVFSGSIPSRISANSAYDLILKFDEFDQNLLIFKNNIDRLIAVSQDLNTQKHAFEAMGRVLQKQFAYSSRDIALLSNDFHDFKTATEGSFIQLLERFNDLGQQLVSRFDVVEQKLDKISPPKQG